MDWEGLGEISWGPISPLLVSRSTRVSIGGIIKTFVLVLVLVQDQSVLSLALYHNREG
jgi:hypothetical protein